MGSGVVRAPLLTRPFPGPAPSSLAHSALSPHPVNKQIPTGQAALQTGFASDLKGNVSSPLKGVADKARKTDKARKREAEQALELRTQNLGMGQQFGPAVSRQLMMLEKGSKVQQVGPKRQKVIGRFCLLLLSLPNEDKRDDV